MQPRVAPAHKQADKLPKLQAVRLEGRKVKLTKADTTIEILGLYHGPAGAEAEIRYVSPVASPPLRERFPVAVLLANGWAMVRGRVTDKERP